MAIGTKSAVKPTYSRTSEKIREKMAEKGMTIKDVGQSLGVTYEHARNVVRGSVLPSRWVIPDLAKSLGLEKEVLEKLVALDGQEKKYGVTLRKALGQNPELAPLEPLWPKLSDEHKKDIMALVETYAQRDAEKGNK